ncbi:MAG: Flp pilus assembly complex ATPase component TadA [Planctomycetes bacterium]|nr:Flp pilus assembly complex ATPase component TadA [Planctomycetota bacterium]
MTFSQDQVRVDTTDASVQLPTGGASAAVELPQVRRTRWKQLGQILVDEGVLTPESLDEALAHQQEGDSRIGQVVVERGLASEGEVMRCLAIQFGRPFVHPTPDQVNRDILDRLPTELLNEHSFLPLEASDGMLTVATDDPANVFLFDEIRRLTNLSVRTVVASRSEIQVVLEEFDRGETAMQVEELISGVEDNDVEVVETESDDLPDLEKVAGESPIIRLANYIISDAVKQGASDIHIEPSETTLRVRYRIDGSLFETMKPPVSMHAALISRIKIMANLDISERRLPQDGRIRAMVRGGVVDLRVSTLPTTAGEKCVIRILDKGSITIGLERLGFSPDNLAMFKAQIAQPHGIILVTGPTGSGKTTTLYSALQELKSDTINISTVEDPVEYRLDFVNQVQVIDRIGMTFAAALRSLLRQDPDVIMVGEIRDGETAKISVQAALTGHLVLSTLHTNDAPSSITRLINIGIEPYLIAASLNAVIAQRLVRRICKHCSEDHEPSDELKQFLEIQGLGDVKLVRGVGCPKCRNTGYSGRVALYELLLMDDTVRDLVTANPSVTELRRLLRERGMMTLREDGFEKMRQGHTTIEEVLRVTEAAH